MINRNHTHTGNCQACGREQAIDIVKNTVAKHGYTVDWNCFNGVCPGSDRLPAQKSVTFTQEIILLCEARATAFTATANRIEAGAEFPPMADHYDSTLEWVSKYGRKHKGKTVQIPFGTADKDEQARAVTNAINFNRHQASGNRDHAAFLKAKVLPLLGTELTSVEQAAVAKKAAQAAKGPTKQSFKDRLDRISRDYYKVHREVMDGLLAMARESRTQAWDDAYDLPYQLSNYRAKHGAAILAVLPGAAEAVAEFGRMFATREAVRAEQKAAGK